MVFVAVFVFFVVMVFVAVFVFFVAVVFVTLLVILFLGISHPAEGQVRGDLHQETRLGGLE